MIIVCCQPDEAENVVAHESICSRHRRKKNRKLERYIEASELAALYNVEPEVWADDRKRRAVYDLIGFLVFLQREKERE